MKVTTEKGHPALIDGAVRITFKDHTGKTMTWLAKKIGTCTWKRLDLEGGWWQKSTTENGTEIVKEEVLVANPDEFLKHILMRMNLHYGKYEPITGEEKER